MTQKKCKTRFQRHSPTPLFWSQVRFLANFGSGLGPAGSQNRLRGAPGTLQNHHRSSSRRRNRPNRLPGGSRKAPRHTQGPPRDHFWMISDRFPKVILEWKVIVTLFFLTMMSNLPNIYQIELLVRNGMSGRRKLSKHRPFSWWVRTTFFGNVSRRSKLLKHK